MISIRMDVRPRTRGGHKDDNVFTIQRTFFTDVFVLLLGNCFFSLWLDQVVEPSVLYHTCEALALIMLLKTCVHFTTKSQNICNVLDDCVCMLRAKYISCGYCSHTDVPDNVTSIDINRTVQLVRRIRTDVLAFGGPVTRRQVASNVTPKDELLFFYKTVVVCDIKGFTTICGRLPFVSGTKVLLDSFIDLADEVASRFNGEVASFLGDAVVLSFNANGPIHSEDALLAVCELIRGINKMERVQCRIGVHTSSVTMGLILSERREIPLFDGDAFTLANRLEAFNKVLGTTALVSDNFTPMLLDRVRTRYVGAFPLNDNANPIGIRELLCT